MVIGSKKCGDLITVLSMALFLFFFSFNAYEVDGKSHPENHPWIYFTEGNQINAINPKGENITKLASSTEPTNAIFSCQTDTLYWIEKSSKIQSLDFSKPRSTKLIFDDEASVLKTMAHELITDKLYIRNDAFRTIEVVDLQTGYRGIIRSEKIIDREWSFEKILDVNSIAVDPNEGYLFILGDSQLKRIDLDGLNITTLESSDNKDDSPPKEPSNVDSITLNLMEKRVYWVNDVNGTIRISSCNYDGTNKKLHWEYKNEVSDKINEPSTPAPVIIHHSDSPFVINHNRGVRKQALGPFMAFLQDTLYWLDYNQGVIRKINLSNSSDSTVIYKGPPKKISSISSIDCGSVEHPQASNPCNNNNGGCQHLCILSRSNETNHRCFCKVGYELAKDGKSCILPTKFIAFTQGTHLRGINWRADTKQFLDVLDPSKRSPGDLTLLDVDTKDEKIFYQSSQDYDYIYFEIAEGKKLMKQPNSSIRLDYEEKKFFNSSRLIDRNLHVDSLKEDKSSVLKPDFMAREATDIAYDWASKNLYYYTHYYGWDDRTLSVLNMKNRTYSKILAKSRWFKFSLAVHPNKGYVFFVEAEATWAPNSRIFRIHSDGSNSTMLLENESKIICITIDYDYDKLYWIEVKRDSSTTVEESLLYFSNLDGKEMTKIEANLFIPSLMGIQGDWIYLINNAKQTLDRLPKKGGDPESLIIADVWGLRIFDPSIQTTRPDHPCANSENKCDKFCFAVPKEENSKNLKRVCGCPYGEKLATDGKSCVDNSKIEPPLIACRSNIRHCVNPHDKETLVMTAFAYKLFLGDTLHV